MKRLLIVFLCGFITLFEIAAQQDPQYSQYMFNHLAVNPGYAGSHDVICLSAVHRQQWVGIVGAPVTSVFTANAPFNVRIKEKTTNHGIGLTVMSDQLGFDQNVSAGLNYAYRFTLGQGRMGIGVSGMFLNKALAAKWFIPPVSGFVPPGDDPAIPLENESVMGFDMGFGVFYRAENVFFGLSSTHLLEPNLHYERTNYQLKRHYYATAGCVLPLNNPAWELAPAMMFYSDGASAQFTANVNMIFNKKVWGGAGYRLNESIIAMVGVDLFDGLKVGYSFDYTYNSLRNYITAGGSHEVMVSYCFSLVKERVVKKYKSVRFL